MSSCPETDKRAAMTDAEFWDHVLNGPENPRSDPDAFWPYNGEHEVIDADPCVECGAVGACSYDNEGRPLIHVQKDDA